MFSFRPLSLIVLYSPTSSPVCPLFHVTTTETSVFFLVLGSLRQPEIFDLGDLPCVATSKNNLKTGDPTILLTN